MAKSHKIELDKVEKELNVLYKKRKVLNQRIFDTEELPQLMAQVGKYFRYATGNEVVKLLEFDVDDGYKVVEYTLQIEKRKPIRFVHAVYWKPWYPFYSIKTASPLGHGYTEIKKPEFESFISAAYEKSNLI